MFDIDRALTEKVAIAAPGAARGLMTAPWTGTGMLSSQNNSSRVDCRPACRAGRMPVPASRP
jgi:hypothetical protein